LKIDLVRMDPAGNITLLVKSPVEKGEYGSVAAALLARKELRAEQVGFLVPPQRGGMLRLEMMGGEFCGNATRGAAFYYARKKGLSLPALVPTEISGCSEVLPVEVREEEAELPMPLPQRRQDVQLSFGSLPFYFFEGIAHGIVLDQKPREEWIREALEALPQVPALGLMFYDTKNAFLEPLVYVRSTNSLYFESSCASGSTALSACLAEELPEGELSLSLRQPGGLLKTRVLRNEKRTARILLSGPVCLLEEQSLEL